jgi:uncharacterized protein
MSVPAGSRGYAAAGREPSAIVEGTEGGQRADNCPAASSAGALEVLKQLVDNGQTQATKVVFAALGVGLLVAESALLSAQGHGTVALALLAILVASAASSIAGFAFSALCGALLFHVMANPVYAVEVMLVCSITIQVFSVATLWRSIDWRSLPVFLMGGVLGVPAGVYLLLHLPTNVYRDVIGGLLIAYGGYLLLRWPTRSLRTGRLADACVGFLGGFTGGLAAFPGAFVTIWCGLKGWDKTRQRGVYQPFILAMQPITLLVIHLMRSSSPTTTQLDWKILVFIPGALLGAWLGLRIFKRLSDRQFELAVNLLLIGSGVGLIL